jgi:hypothetical protein
VAKRLIAPEEILAILAESPDRIARSVKVLAPELLATRPDPESWSALEVLAHIRACCDARGDVIPTIIEEDHPTFRAVNPLVHIETTNYREIPFDQSFRAFAAQREQLLVTLQPLSPDGWERTATVTGAGAPLERSVRFYGDWLARHERAHWKQFDQIAAAFQN